MASVLARNSVAEAIQQSTRYVLCSATGLRIFARSSVVAQFGALAHFTSSAVVSSSTVSMDPPCAFVNAHRPMAAPSPSRNAAVNDGPVGGFGEPPCFVAGVSR